MLASQLEQASMGNKSTTRRWTIRFGIEQLDGLQAIHSSYGDLQPSSTAVASRTDTFFGGELPNWKAIIRAGGNATTIANGVRFYVNGGLSTFDSRTFGYVNGDDNNPLNARRSRVVGPNSIPFGSVPSDTDALAAINDARTKFAKSVEGALTLFSGGVFLGELREALHMIRHPAVGLRRGIGDYLKNLLNNSRRLRKMPRPRRQRAIQQTYLEYVFGWSPFINDLEDASQYLQRKQDQLYQELAPVRGLGRSEWIDSDIANLYGSGFGIVRYRRRNRCIVTAVLAGAISSRASNPKLLDSSSLGVSLRSFVPTLWELLPWSFVADYFSNVGEVLTGWSNQSTHLAWGRDTVIKESLMELYDQYQQPFANTIYVDRSFSPASVATGYRSFSRQPISSPPVPMLRFELPGFGTKWINLAALATARRSLSRLNSP
jgi:hypothetical protein